MSDVTFKKIKRDIEQMTPDEAERLRKWLNAHAARQHNSPAQAPSWGENLVRLVLDFPLEEADQMAIDDPESWVRELRRMKTNRRNPGWGDK